MEKTGIKIAAQNRKAFHEYFVEERFEAGIELAGTEVKSIRAGALTLKDAFCIAKDGRSMSTVCTSPPMKRATSSTRTPSAPGGC